MVDFMTVKSDAQHIRDDRRFFLKNPKRSYYVRRAGELEEIEIQRGTGRDEPGSWVVAVWKQRRSVRLRRLIHIPGLIGDSVSLPRGEDDCRKVFQANNHWLCKVPNGTLELQALPDDNSETWATTLQDDLNTAGHLKQP